MTNLYTKIELATRIVQLVEEHWAEHKKPLLLSDLGSSENGTIGARAKETSGSLKSYLQGSLPDKVTIIQHSSKIAVIGAVPAREKIEDQMSIDELFSVAQTKKGHSAARYHRAVWTAFRKPLVDGRLRYMSKEGVPHFVDARPGSAPEGFVKVDGDLIDAENGDPSLIESRILQWLNENDLDASQFQVKRSVSDPKFPSNDLLSEVLASLELEDLRRISMPLDIVQKLRSKQR